MLKIEFVKVAKLVKSTFFSPKFGAVYFILESLLELTPVMKRLRANNILPWALHDGFFRLHNLFNFLLYRFIF